MDIATINEVLFCIIVISGSTLIWCFFTQADRKATEAMILARIAMAFFVFAIVVAILISPDNPALGHVDDFDIARNSHSETWSPLVIVPAAIIIVAFAYQGMRSSYEALLKRLAKR